MNMKEFRRNRKLIPPDELAKHEGRWAAFSADGKRIIASNADIGALRQQVFAASEDPETTILEFIGMEEGIFVGGAETILCWCFLIKHWRYAACHLRRCRQPPNLGGGHLFQRASSGQL